MQYSLVAKRRQGSLPFEVSEAMEKLYADIDLLLKSELSIEEAFFFASMIHLVFVKIHPWNDGNGRSARLLEKWFLAEKLVKLNTTGKVVFSFTIFFSGCYFSVRAAADQR